MPIVKEKKNILLGMLLVIVTLATILTQYADSILVDYQNSKEKKLLELIKITGNENFWMNNRQIAENDRMQYLLTKIPIKFKTEELTDSHDLEYIELINNCNKDYEGEDIQLECHSNIVSFFNSKAINAVNEYNEAIPEYEKLVMEKPKLLNISWNYIKNISVIIQIITITLVLILYMVLFFSVGRKYLTGIENKYEKLKLEHEKLIQKTKTPPQ